MRGKEAEDVIGVMVGDTFPANGEWQVEETWLRLSHGVPLGTRDTLTPSACPHAFHDSKKRLSNIGGVIGVRCSDTLFKR